MQVITSGDSLTTNYQERVIRVARNKLDISGNIDCPDNKSDSKESIRSYIAKGFLKGYNDDFFKKELNKALEDIFHKKGDSK